MTTWRAAQCQPLHIQLRDSSDDLLWAAGGGKGFTSATYAEDGTLTEVIAALETALEAARFELRGLNVAEAGADVGRASAQVQNDVPVASIRYGYPDGEVRMMPTVVLKLLPALIPAKVDIVRDMDVAAMRAVNDDYITLV